MENKNEAERFAANCSNIPHELTPKADDLPLVFRHFNFKLAVVEVLMYEKELLTPKFNVWEFARNGSGRSIDIESEGYAPIPEAIRWFKQLAVPARLAEEITEIEMDGGSEVYGQIWPFWDGEDDYFDLDAVDEDELRQFPKLRRAAVFASNEQAVVPVFRKCGVEVSNAYDVPFEMDEDGELA